MYLQNKQTLFFIFVGTWKLISFSSGQLFSEDVWKLFFFFHVEASCDWNLTRLLFVISFSGGWFQVQNLWLILRMLVGAGWRIGPFFKRWRRKITVMMIMRVASINRVRKGGSQANKFSSLKGTLRSRTSLNLKGRSNLQRSLACSQGKWLYGSKTEGQGSRPSS